MDALTHIYQTEVVTLCLPHRNWARQKIAVKHFQAVFLQTAEQCQWHNVVNVQLGWREPWLILTSFKKCDMVLLNAVIGM